MISTFKSIAPHCLKDPTGFSLDLAAVFPYEVIALTISKPDISIAVVLYLWLQVEAAFLISPVTLPGVRLDAS